MGLSVVNGKILIEYGKGEKSREYIKSIGEDEYYPFLSTNMFSNGAEKRPQFYDQQVFSFAATYKNVEYGHGFKVFILKFEKILQELEFETAHVELETEIGGTYRFFWKKIEEPDAILDQYEKEDFQLIRTADWYFGFGYRNDSGSLNIKLKDEQIFNYDNFVYPVEISDKTLLDFKSLTEEIKKQETGEKIYIRNIIKNQWAKSEELFFYLSKLQIDDKIEFEYEGEKGYSVLKLKEF